MTKRQSAESEYKELDSTFSVHSDRERDDITRSVKLRIHKDPTTLTRHLENNDGVVVCQCDGTLQAVMSCLAASRSIYPIGNDELLPDAYLSTEKEFAHLVDLQSKCAYDGAQRLNSLLPTKASKERVDVGDD